MTSTESPRTAPALCPEIAERSMGHKPGGRRRKQNRPGPDEKPGDIGWMEYGGTSMFVVGWTSGGVPYGMTGEEMARAEERGSHRPVEFGLVDPSPPKALAVDMLGLEIAFEDTTWEHLYYLDLETGEVLMVTEEIEGKLERTYEEVGEGDVVAHVEALDLPEWMKEAIMEAHRVRQDGDRIVDIPKTAPRTDYHLMEDFIATVTAPALRNRLEQAIQGRGAFRRFRDTISSNPPEQRRWRHFQRQALWSEMIDWLHSIGVEPTLESPPEPEPEPPRRPRLLAEVVAFVEAAKVLPGVSRIALLGSLTTEEMWPKDADLLVTVDDDTDLAPLAKLARRMAGHAQSMGMGANVFLADPAGRYLGRTCPWTRCAPGVRASCDALHCGRRTYLHDDLDTVRLHNDVMTTPPVELWPTVSARVTVPADVRAVMETLSTG